MTVRSWIGTVILLLSLVSTARAKTASVWGRVIDDTTCDDDGDATCKGLHDATIVVWDAAKTLTPATRPCAYKAAELLWRGVSQADGSFRSSPIATSTRAAFDVCLGRHEQNPHHEVRMPSATRSSTIRLTPIPQNDEQARHLVERLHARAQRKASAAHAPLGNFYAQEWAHLESISYPPEAKAMVAAAFKRKNAAAAAHVKGIDLYAGVDADEIAACRSAMEKSAGEPSAVVCWPNSAFPVPASIFGDIVSDVRKEKALGLPRRPRRDEERLEPTLEGP